MNPALKKMNTTIHRGSINYGKGKRPKIVKKNPVQHLADQMNKVQIETDDAILTKVEEAETKEEQEAQRAEAKRIQQLTGGKHGEAKQYQAPESLDLFSLETRARRTIGELIKPIVQESDNDRRRVAEVISKQDRIGQRLAALEYSLGLTDTRPKLFQEIDNKIADIRALIAENKNDGDFKQGINDQRLDKLEIDGRQMQSDFKAVQNLTQMRDVENKRSNQLVEQI